MRVISCRHYSAGKENVTVRMSVKEGPVKKRTDRDEMVYDPPRQFLQCNKVVAFLHRIEMFAHLVRDLSTAQPAYLPPWHKGEEVTAASFVHITFAHSTHRCHYKPTAMLFSSRTVTLIAALVANASSSTSKPAPDAAMGAMAPSPDAAAPGATPAGAPVPGDMSSGQCMCAPMPMPQCTPGPPSPGNGPPTPGNGPPSPGNGPPTPGSGLPSPPAPGSGLPPVPVTGVTGPGPITNGPSTGPPGTPTGSIVSSVGKSPPVGGNGPTPPGVNGTTLPPVDNSTTPDNGTEDSSASIMSNSFSLAGFLAAGAVALAL
ncbi:hypothetical protein Pst134EA_006774 [Puccinia striiformis f. sp. tritici]|nr:hypothetical protein Pst134EA_006774 [Puccinia striiformis f. sp. tritici]KAH9469484.1 hypothetical protein Pst134EA_006774 [Puccinia striiformis f. sp. tritici]